MVMYKIDRRGGGVQKSFSRTDPKYLFKRIIGLSNVSPFEMTPSKVKSISWSSAADRTF